MFQVTELEQLGKNTELLELLDGEHGAMSKSRKEYSDVLIDAIGEPMAKKY